MRILIFSDFKQLFMKKSRKLLFSAIKSKVVEASKAYKLTERYKPARFTILIHVKSLKPIIFKILTSFAEKMAKNMKFSNFTSIVS